jgi:hypothetical protein
MFDKTLRTTLKNNLDWFFNSGVMIPEDGKWGVAERVAVTAGNISIEKMYKSFPAWTEFDGYSIIEQRRADCNFETALMFLLAYEVFNDKKYYETAENILDFLYFKSGMLNRFDEKYPDACWNWSHIKWTPNVWFDDNGWNCVLQLLIGKKFPEFAKKYDMIKFGMRLADGMLPGFNRTFGCVNKEAAESWIDPEGVWMGRLNLPHWGSLACMAFTIAYTEEAKTEYADAVKRYHEYLSENKESFIVSEQAYALLSSSWAANVFDDSLYKKLTTWFADSIVSRMDPKTGNIPAEHYEAPVGPHLADTIYTVNWALLGMQCAASIDNSESYRQALDKLLNLVVEIQDKTEAKQFKGCWRGMFDLNAGTWGGGDCYEGGAGSIYTGWTNAPISWVIAFELLKKSLIMK